MLPRPPFAPPAAIGSCGLRCMACSSALDKRLEAMRTVTIHTQCTLTCCLSVCLLTARLEKLTQLRGRPTQRAPFR